MSVDEIRELFRARGLRCTRQRERIYRALAATKSHPTAEELLALVERRAGDESLSLATVYNTLDVFLEKGLARQFRSASHASGPVPARYDADVSDHAHLIEADGSVRDLPEDLSRRVMDRLGPELVAELERRMGVRVKGVEVHVRGE
ncbi:MAG: transcriptional repressor [Planctomycetota bacterium]|nr:transcriptional repressor [Planctomycetota bacterium]